MPNNNSKYIRYIDQLNAIGIALSAEKDHDVLLETIMLSAVDIVHADGGSLYLLENNHLALEIFINQSLNIYSHVKKAKKLNIPPIALYDTHGKAHTKNIAAHCFLQNKTLHIPDAYHAKGFDFTSMKIMDKKLNYHSMSFLVIPLRNHENKVIGVLQLINALDDKTGKVIPFQNDKIHIAESLASQAAVAISHETLITSQKNLFEALIKLIAKTIDEKSKYTSEHCERVPILTLMIAEAAQNASSGVFKDFHFTNDEMEELRIAAWLHDCGKIATPVHIVDKSTKLETISDRIEVIELRIEILLRDLKIDYLEKFAATTADETKTTLKQAYENKVKALQSARAFLKKTNIGAEFLSDEDKAQILTLSEYSYHSDNKEYPLLSDQDIVNLSVSRGTLNAKDRAIINYHVVLTKRMLSFLPYPDYLKKVPEIAGDHHEALNGKGYPEGLKADQISIQARMLTIADIFEALTAKDRPYKNAKTLKETLNIMAKMKNQGYIDPDLFELFVDQKIYLEYAKAYLNPSQIDV